MSYRLIRGRKSKMRERTHSASFLFIQEIERIEALHFASEPSRILFGVKFFDEISPALAIHQGAPGRRHVISARRDQTESSNYYSTFHKEKWTIEREK